MEVLPPEPYKFGKFYKIDNFIYSLNFLVFSFQNKNYQNLSTKYNFVFLNFSVHQLRKKVTLRKRCRFISLRLFLDQLADLVTSLDLEIPFSHEKQILSGIIYRYACSNCRVNCYRKKFSQFFRTASEHMGALNKTGKRVKNTKESAISDHLLSCDCPIDFYDFDILS